MTGPPHAVHLVPALAAWLDPVAALREMWALPFMVNAFRAGTLAAVLAGTAGWFMVARRQTFAGHTLSVVGFPGAAGAVLVGAPVWLGYLGATMLAALALGRTGGRRGEGDGALIGTVQAFALACGFWFVASYSGLLGGTTSLLFGSILGITSGQVTFLAVVTVAALAVLAASGRRLLFVTVDPAVAGARGVGVRRTDVAFLLLLAVAVAATVEVTGALLAFALLVLPAASAQRVTARPATALGLSVLMAATAVWAALTVAFYTPYPFGFWLTTLAFAGYLLAVALDRWHVLTRWRHAWRPSARWRHG